MKSEVNTKDVLPWLINTPLWYLQTKVNKWHCYSVLTLFHMRREDKIDHSSCPTVWNYIQTPCDEHSLDSLVLWNHPTWMKLKLILKSCHLLNCSTCTWRSSCCLWHISNTSMGFFISLFECKSLKYVLFLSYNRLLQVLPSQRNLSAIYSNVCLCQMCNKNI